MIETILPEIPIPLKEMAPPEVLTSPSRRPFFPIPPPSKLGNFENLVPPTPADWGGGEGHYATVFMTSFYCLKAYKGGGCVCFTANGNILASGKISLKLFMAPLETIGLLTF